MTAGRKKTRTNAALDSERKKEGTSSFLDVLDNVSGLGRDLEVTLLFFLLLFLSVVQCIWLLFFYLHLTL